MYIGLIFFEILEIVLLQEGILVYFPSVLGIVHEFLEELAVLLHSGVGHETTPPLGPGPWIVPAAKLPLEFGLLLLSLQVPRQCPIDFLGVDYGQLGFEAAQAGDIGQGLLVQPVVLNAGRRGY